jgi:heat shock protein HslJ
LIELGQCVQISWSTGGGTDNVKLLRDGVVILDGAQLGGNAQDCPGTTGSKTYRVEARNRVGDLASEEQQVSVNDAAPTNPLANTTWQLATLNGAAALEGVNVNTYFGADYNLSGTGGCNNYAGTYNVNGTAISIGSISSQGALCGEDVMNQESAFFTALQSAATFEVGGGTLTIRDSGGTVILTFAQLAAVPS